MKNKSKTKKENPHKFTFEQIEDEAIAICLTGNVKTSQKRNYLNMRKK